MYFSATRVKGSQSVPHYSFLLKLQYETVIKEFTQCGAVLEDCQFCHDSRATSSRVNVPPLTQHFHKALL